MARSAEKLSAVADAGAGTGGCNPRTAMNTIRSTASQANPAATAAREAVDAGAGETFSDADMSRSILHQLLLNSYSC
jgi:hypothetical protein